MEAHHELYSGGGRPERRRGQLAAAPLVRGGRGGVEASRARAEVEVAGRGDATAAGAEGASVVEAGGAVRRRGGRSEAGGNRERRGEWRKKGWGLSTLSLWHRMIISSGT